MRSTDENVKAAMEGEKYERDVMYPEFIEAAKGQKASLATCTFIFALKVEAIHAVLFQDALDELEKLRGGQHSDYMCPGRGNTLSELTIVKCLMCGHPRSGLVAVN